MTAKDDDVEAFFAELSDVRRIKQTSANVHVDAAQKLAVKQQKAMTLVERLRKEHPLPLDNIVPVDPHDYLHFQQAGIQDAVFKNLRLGKYPVEFKLSLKGLSIEESAARLYRTICDCHEKGMRTLLIEHGRGLESKPFQGYKRSCVKRWLDELTEVIAYHSAQPQHGGLAATYVMLKKHPLQKQINREKNRKR